MTISNSIINLNMFFKLIINFKALLIANVITWKLLHLIKLLKIDGINFRYFCNACDLFDRLGRPVSSCYENYAGKWLTIWLTLLFSIFPL